MKFNTNKAKNSYYQMFGEKLDQQVIDVAKGMTDKEFSDNETGVDDDGEYLESEFSSGQYDCIENARY